MSDGKTDLSDACYAFNVHLMCGGYAYFSTLTEWIDFGDSFREYRAPSMFVKDKLTSGLRALGHRPLQVNHEDDYRYWLLRGGWALAGVDAARSIMPQWLKKRLCLKTPFKTYTDVELAAPNALEHHAHPGKRNVVLARDGYRCISCGKTRDEGADLTMHHVTPRSRGGETTTWNLVTLCEPCNQRFGNDAQYGMFAIANLPHGFDRRLIGTHPENFTADWLIRLSSNLMYTRCDVF